MLKSPPDFIIAGAPKAGSSLLYELLRQHSEIKMSVGKEPNIYLNNWGNDITEYQFEGVSLNQLKGEATVGYFNNRDVPQRIYKTNPKTKLIFCLRNPIDRTYSHYWHGVKGMYEKRSWENIIEQEINFDEYLFSHSLYNTNINHFLEYFSVKNIHFFILEDYEREGVSILNKTLSFLGVKDVSHNLIQTSEIINKGKTYKNVWLQTLLNWFKTNKRFVPKYVRKQLSNQYDYIKKANETEIPNSTLTEKHRKMLMSLFSDEVKKLSKTFSIEFSWEDFRKVY
ncbi:sulfotransferase domain-containing protein [Fulvivirga lutea]|uniref:Sulfotransferase domain-containing protein n=1 Tax=Fulvivirga lutea TaxID=2810512 RepID=A0A974WES4_9BACT|nr:sulfotransferase domain-containing protein [Fulvivirga lutea]QSE96811.1 sulfotransferase domain-containing protein [Fulvivirga lutea]